MASRPFLFLGAVSLSSLLAVASCSLAGLSDGAPLDGGGDVATTDRDAFAEAEPSGDAGASSDAIDENIYPPCAVRVDGKLWCHFSPFASLHAQPFSASPVVANLSSNNAYGPFDCWTTGELHPGGNTTWYRAKGSEGPALGVPTEGWAWGYDLHTPPSFDSDPSDAGLMFCP
ncbi:MAG: hypothetical protein ABIP89_00565 [Polyangiaceae bacterium]